MPTRRHFLAGLSTAAAATWLQPLRGADPRKDTVVGHGRFRYKVIRGGLDTSGVSDRRQARSKYGAKKGSS